ncbi:MAG TPA: hypothetical protein VGI45_09180 [Terracidiphilus sp.]|jgi:hypothetical protein
MDTTDIIRFVAACLFLCVIAVGIAYIAFISGVLKKCSPQSRTMQPGMVWLLLIPLFNVVWNFLVVNAIADSLSNEFRLRNLPVNEQKPGRSLGLAMAICGACGIIPFVNLIAILPHFILWLIYWVKIAGYSRMLDGVPVTIGAPANPSF